MGSNSLFEYNQILSQLKTYTNIPQHLISSFSHFNLLIYQSDQQNRFSQPMLWIGIYIVLASLLCTLAMVADLVHGIHNRKLWFPCKYFTLNAASLSVIAVAIKLPMDLNNSMPGQVDLDAKVGSLAFMCTMMANVFPSLATMDNKELLTNIVALGVLVITLVVNVCMQINTGLLSLYHHEELLVTSAEAKDQSPYIYAYAHRYGIVATVYVGFLLMLLIIYVCSSIAILKTKQILNSKYQGAHETILKDLQSDSAGRLTAEKLKQHVRNYWIMAGTSSPQFVTACSATTSASGVICACSVVFPVYMVYLGFLRNYKSDYKWSTLVIFITQFIGVILGSIAPLFRCFEDLSFSMSINWMWNHINVFKVESFWTQKLCDWKYSSIAFSISSRKSKIVIQNLINVILSVCIGLQKMVVVACKMIAFIPIFLVIGVLYCIRGWKWMEAMFSSEGTQVLVTYTPGQLEKFKDIGCYVLTLEDDIELADRTLTGITKSVNRVTRKAVKQQPNNLMKLLEECSGFIGDGDVTSLQADDYLSCWSLTLVTLATIAVSLPNIPKETSDRLLSSVSEGLVYVTLVEETFNASDDYVRMRKAAKSLWLEVEVYHKWLGNKLRKLAPQVKTTKQILESFRDTAENMPTEMEDLNICAKTMYRTTKSILFSYHTTIDMISQEELFGNLSSMIGDILAACLTNLPQVIAMKCHTDVIEKREVSVHAAARLLGETMQIINMLQDHQLPSCLNTYELLFIDKWRAYLKHPLENQ